MVVWPEILKRVEAGELRAAEIDKDGIWHANQEVKGAICDMISSGKVEHKGNGFFDIDTCDGKDIDIEDEVRIPYGGTSIRSATYISKKVVILPPAFINWGAYIDANTMIDSHVLVGSCAQIGKNVHISAGVVIGGVLEPKVAMPVIVEDDAFIGAGARLLEGTLVKSRAIIGPGVVISKSTNIYDIVEERILPKGAPVPNDAIVVSGTRSSNTEWGKSNGINIYCPVIVKYRDEKTDTKVALNSVLRR